jgi:DNA invertase Pin-like site-specific DNA recombinase
MRAAIYARMSMKAQVKCPHCGKVVRVVNDALLYHLDSGAAAACPGSEQPLDDAANRGQDTGKQLLQLREYCVRQGWEITNEYIDYAIGRHGARDSFQRLFDDASQRQFDMVLVWALDRFTRERVLETFEYVRDLVRSGIAFESYTEAHFRTSGPAGELMLPIAAWIAQQERLRISERTKAGVERARKQGKHGGRPRRVFRRDEVVQLRGAGKSWRAIAREMGVPMTTLRDAVRRVSRGPLLH